MDEAIDKMDTVAAPHVVDNDEHRRTAERKVRKEVWGMLEYLLDVHGLPTGWKWEGVTRVIYEKLKWLAVYAVKE